MINDPIYIQSILEKLKKVTYKELDEAIQKVDREFDGIDYSYEEVYNIECNYKNYYIDTSYCDFDLHTNGTRKQKSNKRIEEAA